MNEKIFLNGLTSDSVTIMTQKYTTVDGVDYSIGIPNAKGYANSTSGREELKAEIKEPYLSAILAMWGEAATVVIESTI